jgi:hypothetical protein
MVRLVTDGASAKDPCREWDETEECAVVRRVAIEVDDREEVRRFMRFVSGPDQQGVLRVLRAS